MSRPTAFLEHVWSVQPPGRVTVARKNYATGAWDERSIRSTQRVRGAGTDVYFTPCTFGGQNHKSEHALPSRWLYADLDAVHYDVAIFRGLCPTYAWETSPGRYQAMWLLDRALKREPFEELNRRVTYFLGADKSGWDVAQLLRIPGSVSTKHGAAHKVTLLLDNRRLEHAVEDVSARVRHVQVDATAAWTSSVSVDTRG